MSENQIKRPKNMSLLDYLWSNYGSYKVSNSLDEPQSIPTSEAVKLYAQDVDTGIVKLDTLMTLDHRVRIFGQDKKGGELTSIYVDEDTKIISFKRKKITLEDIDNGLLATIGEDFLVLETNKEELFWISINDLILLGQDTNTVITLVVNSKIASLVKIDNPIVDRSVDIKATDNGLQANLIINPDTKSNVLLVKGNNGVETKFVWDDTETPIGFKFITFSEYQLINPKEGTIYFITDDPAIYFNGIKFSSIGLDPNQYATKDDLKYAVQDEKDRAEAVENYLDELILELGDALEKETEERILADKELENSFNWIEI